MSIKTRKIVFLCTIVALLVLAASAADVGAHTEAQNIRLDNDLMQNTNHELTPGHWIEVTMTAQAHNGLTFFSEDKDSKMQVGPLYIELGAEETSWNHAGRIFFIIKWNNEKVYDKTIQEIGFCGNPFGCGKVTVQADVKVWLDCGGMIHVYYNDEEVYSNYISSSYLDILKDDDTRLNEVGCSGSCCSVPTSSTSISTLSPEPIDNNPPSEADVLKDNWKTLLAMAGLGIVAVLILLLKGGKKLFVIVVIAVVLLILMYVPVITAMASSYDIEAQRLMYNYSLDRAVCVVRWQHYYGTGWFINEHYIITAAHVMSYNNGTDVDIIKYPYEVHGTVVFIDRKNDIAVIRVDSSIPNAKVLKLAKSVRKGDKILVVGYPYELLLITGDLYRMSANPRAAFGHINWVDSSKHLAEIGASTDAGNSGGPVINANTLCVEGIVTKALIGEAATLYYMTTADKIIEDLRKAGVPFEVKMSFMPNMPSSVNILDYKKILMALGGVAVISAVVTVITYNLISRRR